MGLLKSGWMQPVVEEPTAADSEAETETQADEMRDRALGFGTDKGQFKGILRVVMHDLDDLVFDEVAGGEVPAELILQRDFGKNERRPLRFGTIEDLPPY